MTPADAAERLGQLGLDARDLESRRTLFDLVLSRFHTLGVGPPEHLFWVPGRLEVFGKHTDYAGGRTLVAAVPRGFVIAASGRPGTKINVFDAGRSQSASFETNAPDLRPSRRSQGSVGRLAPLRAHGHQPPVTQFSGSEYGSGAGDCKRSSESIRHEQFERTDGRRGCRPRTRRRACSIEQSGVRTFAVLSMRPRTMRASRTGCRLGRWRVTRAWAHMAAVRITPPSSLETRARCPPSRSYRCATFWM